MLKKYLSVFLIVIFALLPAVLNAQIGLLPVAHPKEEAAKDAKNDINHLVWFGSGCVLGPLGLAAAYFIEPSPPPADRLMGKSNVYIKEYTTVYKREMKDSQISDALGGCIPVTLVLFSIIFLTTRSNGD